jgi:hypothetical protein
MAAPKFIVDLNLGRLAKWLRIMAVSLFLTGVVLERYYLHNMLKKLAVVGDVKR